MSLGLGWSMVSNFVTCLMRILRFLVSNKVDSIQSLLVVEVLGVS